jgi:integrase
VKEDAERYALFLVGAEAGLRQGEMTAIAWADVDFVTRPITVRRSVWRGISRHAKEWARPKEPDDRAALRSAEGASAPSFRSDLLSRRRKLVQQSAFEAALRYTYKRSGASPDRHPRPSSVIPSARTSQCAVRRRRRSKSSRGTRRLR